MEEFTSSKLKNVCIKSPLVKEFKHFLSKNVKFDNTVYYGRKAMCRLHESGRDGYKLALQ